METIFIIILVCLLLISIFARKQLDNIVYKIIYGVALISMVYYAFIYPDKFYYAILMVVFSLPLIVKKLRRVQS